MTTSPGLFDQRQLRDVLGTFVTGVTVITTRDAQGIGHGVTANSFSSVSLDPPLVLWSQALTSKSCEAFRDSDYFAVNILADDQIGISNHFAKSFDDKFNGITHQSGIGGVPILDGAAAHLECVKVAAYPSGDHVIYIGRVENIGHYSRRALAFASGKYMLAHASELEAAYSQADGLQPVPLPSIRLATASLPALATALGDHTLCLSVWGNHGPTTLQWEASAQPVSDQLFSGLVMPVTQSATGRLFAALLPENLTRHFIEDEVRVYPVAGEDLSARRSRFAEEIAEVRQKGLGRGFATTPSPLHKVAVTTFSAPILNAQGSLVMVLTVASPTSRLSPDWEGAVPRGLALASAQISRQLGYSPDLSGP